MSWSISYIGTPEKVEEAMNGYGNTLSGLSKDEYDAAMPSMLALLKQNEGGKKIVKIVANGHAHVGTDSVKYGQFYCLIEPMHGEVCV